MTGSDFAQAIPRYRHLSFFAFIALALKWHLNDGGRPHPPRVDARRIAGAWRARRWWRNREWRIVAVIALLEWRNDDLTRGG